MQTYASPVDILAVGVHPDDVELSASGTCLAHVDRGYSLGLLDLTRGELGSRGTAEIRTKEALESADRMGATFRVNLDLPDGFIRGDEESLRKIITVIRAAKPRIVLANALGDRHPDHGRAAKIVADACFYAGLVKIETLDAEGGVQEKHRPDQVHHYIQDHNRKPDFVVGIDGFLDQKMHCIAAFRSQFNDGADNEFKDEPKTPISGADFMSFVRAKARNFGREGGFEYAEGFETSRCPGVRDLFDLT